VVSRANLNNFEEIIPYALEMGISGIDFEYLGEIPQESISKSAIAGLTPTPFFMSSGPSLLLDKRRAILLKKKLEKIRRDKIKNGLRVNTQKIDFLSTEELVSGRFPNKKCYICRDIVTIDPYGDVMGCLHFNNYHLGNIRKQDLKSIWKNKKHMYFMEIQRNSKIDICKFCSNGLLRNYTPIQYLQSQYFEVTRRARI
jgi:MoaA/NifB/PqqE/SkfB family radical SAM enzyme